MRRRAAEPRAEHEGRTRGMLQRVLRILVVEDDRDVREAVVTSLRDEGDDVVACAEATAAIEELQRRAFDLVISDVRLPGRLSGMDVLHAARSSVGGSAPEVVLMTSFADVRQVVAALQAGARDYLTKPFEIDELLVRVGHVREKRRLEEELERARQRLGEAGGLERVLVGECPAMVRLRDRIATVAPSDLPVLVSGESGTGKELVARAIHDLGPRRAGPFVAVNCAAFPESLLEAELFGYERGAFTGAQKKRAGRFQAASGGTLFLDEVGEMPLAAQVKLLRAAQDGRVTPLGSDEPIATDVRIVSATNRDLRAMIGEKAFREDLYYRLAGVLVHVPPLRDRSGDVPLLVEHFLRLHASAKGSGALPQVDVDAWSVLRKHPYPGNVRELAHAVEHAIVMSRGEVIRREHLPEDMTREARGETGSETVLPLSQSMKRFEREQLLGALAASGGKRTKAAELLGISRKNLWEKLKAHDISDSDVDD